ncbi:hypothetical protein FACS1894152_2040 [Bacilli bacterium]|nr:hypothetical protein FACS1894152_2040 [Bacilli bacterium]
MQSKKLFKLFLTNPYQKRSDVDDDLGGSAVGNTLGRRLGGTDNTLGGSGDKVSGTAGVNATGVGVGDKAFGTIDADTTGAGDNEPCDDKNDESCDDINDEGVGNCGGANVGPCIDDDECSGVGEGDDDMESTDSLLTIFGFCPLSNA